MKTLLIGIGLTAILLVGCGGGESVSPDPGFTAKPPADGDAGACGCEQGENGKPGADGAAGPPGAPGAAGEPGPVGATGLTGADGADGAPGPAGATGSPGADGAPGLMGAVGPQGPIGPKGNAGATGLQGSIGPAGATGAVGPTGASGADGAPGTPLTKADTYRIVSSATANQNTVASIDALCLAGDVLLSGSCDFPGGLPQAPMYLSQSEPYIAGSQSWKCSAYNPNNVPRTVRAMALCYAAP